jgi:hypothetical protein
MTKGKVPWNPDVQIEVEVRSKGTYFRSGGGPISDELVKEIETELLQSKEQTGSNLIDTGWEHFTSLGKSSRLYEKALLGDIQSALELSKIVAAKVKNNEELEGAEEEYFQQAMQSIARGEQANEAFLTSRKNGKKNVSHIPDRNQWIYEEIWVQLESGKRLSEAANSIYTIMSEFHHRSEVELAEAEASGIVDKLEKAEKLLSINTPISPERIGDIFEEQYFKNKREVIEAYLASRALREKLK